MQKLVVTIFAALALAGCGASQTSSNHPSSSPQKPESATVTPATQASGDQQQLRQLDASFKAAYAAKHASEACSLFTAFGRTDLANFFFADSCEAGLRYAFSLQRVPEELVSVRVNGKKAVLGYRGGHTARALKQSRRWKFDNVPPLG